MYPCQPFSFDLEHPEMTTIATSEIRARKEHLAQVLLIADRAPRRTEMLDGMPTT
jgi:hypothetical protein